MRDPRLARGERLTGDGPVSRAPRRRDRRRDAARQLDALAQIPARTLPSGDYELWLTAAGNPADVLFASALSPLRPAHDDVIVDPEGGEPRPVHRGPASCSAVHVLFDRNARRDARHQRRHGPTAARLRRSTASLRRRSSRRRRSRPTPYPPCRRPAQTINVTPPVTPACSSSIRRFARSPVRSTLLFAGGRAR